MNKKRFGLFLGIAVFFFILVVVGLWVMGVYNTLNRLDQGVRSQWAQVENVYQRRADLVPNLVETVKGAAAFERETFAAVTEARAKVGQIQVGADVVNDPEAFARFEQVQSELGSTLARLLVAVERYPELKATENFRDLQVQLEGTENRIAQERRVFNESAQAFNTRRMSFPTVTIAGMFGPRFSEKPYFKAQAGADLVPPVKF
ncbi:MAG: LemA family protein [Acidobacteriota bacterium]|nr:LemA family protein [Acidobacteriota bacterium]